MSDSAMCQWLFFFAALAVTFLPSTVMVTAATQSLSPGFIAASLFTILLTLPIVWVPNFGIGLSNQKAAGVVIFLLISIIIQSMVVGSIYGFGDSDRMILGLAGLSVGLFSALISGVAVAKVSSSTWGQIIVLLSLLLFFNGIVSIIGLNLGGLYSQKPTFAFYEPSHYALSCAPFIMTCCAYNWRIKYLVVAFAIAWGGVVQSFLMIVVAMAALLLSSKPRNALALCLVFTFVIVLIPDLSYYLDRLSFSSESENLTVLVVLQGWQNAWLAFVETGGIGVGFQQFGIIGSSGDIAEKVEKLAGFQMNLLDGGTTASKIVGEFGILGIALLAGWVLMAWRAVWIYRSDIFSQFDVRRVFSASCIIVYGFELFVRGVGYFSSGLYLLVVSIPVVLSAPEVNRPKGKFIEY